MAREKKKPDFTNIGSNPLANSLKINANKKVKDVINIFGKPDVIESILDGCKFLKVFEVKGAKEKMMRLNIRAKEMLLYLYHTVKYKTDYVWIDKEVYMKAHEITSINTFKKAINDLCEEKYIYKHHLPEYKDVYWINPQYFFKGSRIDKYKNKVVYTNKKDEGDLDSED